MVVSTAAAALVVLIALAGVAASSPLQYNIIAGDNFASRALKNAETCGINKFGAAEDKIVGGREARPHTYPWLASLWVEDTDYGVDDHMCGAAVINKQFLLTAAHCFAGYEQATSWKAVLGEHDFSKEEGSEIWRKVEKLIIHENYDPYLSRNDIALVKLAEPLDDLPSSDFAVNTICLPEAADDFTGMKCKVAGWGRLRDFGELPDTLQEVELPVFGWEKCRSYRFYKERVWKTNICAGLDEGGKDSCQGDSGGPLMCAKSDGRFYLSGIVSWGMGCAMRNSPGVYTATAQYLKWIQDSVEKND